MLGGLSRPGYVVTVAISCLRSVLHMQVVFHLQNQEPAILPPLCDLFQQDPDVLKGRPLHAGKQGRQDDLDVSSSPLCGVAVMA